MTPPNEPPSNPYDPDWPKPEQPAQGGGNEPPSQPPSQQPSQPPNQPPNPAWGQPSGEPSTQPYGQDPYAQQPPPAAGQPYAPYGQQQPYGQAPYGQVPYGAPPYGAPMAPKHPSATTAMVLGIGALGGMFVCGIPIVLAPFAWMIGGRVVKEIDADPGRYSGREQAQAGRIMGMIGTALLVLGLIAVVGLIALAFVVPSNSGELSYDPNTGYTTSGPSN
ncbi:DUF4190 domain-containing protein [Nocardioides sp.]|uniref:DUF4190 domain-containing protein n=1 Tax=Nocardioides sp. TaxID=35761 RepID=UPI00286DE47A|nr:DUF4190 domain-containing protein [Nocardioides sp.]